MNFFLLSFDIAHLQFFGMHIKVFHFGWLVTQTIPCQHMSCHFHPLRHRTFFSLSGSSSETNIKINIIAQL